MKRQAPDGRQESRGCFDDRCLQFGRKFVTLLRGHIRYTAVQEGFISQSGRARVYLPHSHRGGRRHCTGFVRPGLLCGGPCGSCQLRRRLLVLPLRVIHAALVQFQAVATPDHRFSRGCFPPARLLQARIHGLGGRASWGGRAHSRTVRGAGLLWLLVCRKNRRPPLPASSRAGRSIFHTRRSMRGFLRCCGRTMSP